MDEPRETPPTKERRDIDWTRRAVFVGIGVVGVILAYVIGGRVIPVEWSQFVGRQVDQSLPMAVAWGLFYGIVATFLPLLVLFVGFRKRRPWKVWIAFVVAALVLAAPNLMTLGIVVGSGSAAHDAERTFSTEAPYFRAWNAIGAVIGALLFVFVLWTAFNRHRLRERERDLQAERRRLDEERAAMGRDAPE